MEFEKQNHLELDGKNRMMTYWHGWGVEFQIHSFILQIYFELSLCRHCSKL